MKTYTGARLSETDAGMIDYRCSKCGTDMQSPDSLRGTHETCPKCGSVIVVPRGPDAACSGQVEPATLRFTRNSIFGRFTRVDVMLDGRSVGSVPVSNQLVVTATPGRHWVTIRSDPLTSDHEIETDPGELVELQVRLAWNSILLSVNEGRSVEAQDEVYRRATNARSTARRAIICFGLWAGGLALVVLGIWMAIMGINEGRGFLGVAMCGGAFGLASALFKFGLSCLRG